MGSVHAKVVAQLFYADTKDVGQLPSHSEARSLSSIEYPGYVGDVTANYFGEVRGVYSGFECLLQSLGSPLKLLCVLSLRHYVSKGMDKDIPNLLRLFFCHLLLLQLGKILYHSYGSFVK